MPAWCASWSAAPPSSASSATAGSRFTDGREFEFAAVPLPDGNALFTMLDVTASRTVEAALRERTEALEEADRLKTAFVSNMSYELRTPLTSIGGFAEMLAGGYAGELAPTAAEYVAAILDSVARLGALIDDVLDLTQSDSGSLLLAEDKVDLAKLCAEAAEAFRELAAKKDDRFRGRDRDRRRHRSPATGRGCASRSTMCSRTPSPIPTRAAGSCSTPPATAKEAAITVSDNGRGIAPADQARVFDRFSSDRRAARRRRGRARPRPAARQAVRRGAWRHDRASVGAGRGHHRHPSPAAAALMLPRQAPRRPRRIGRRLAAQLRAGDVVALFGDLGAGKTTLARGLLAGLGHEGEVASPTFPIVIPYEDARDFRSGMSTSTGSRIPAELEELALDEALAGRCADHRMAGTAGRPPCGRMRFASPCGGTGRAPAP